MKTTDPNIQKYKDLLKQKRRLLDKMRKHRKSLARARVDKKRVNEEITRLRKSGFAFSGMTAVEAQERVSGEIRNVTPEDIYPKDLERRFDKLERTTEVKYRKDSVDISDLDDDSQVPRPKTKDDDEGIYAVTLEHEDGVVDLGENETDDYTTEPKNEDAE
jgi:hypothetical protein